jgi:hypothetical protein
MSMAEIYCTTHGCPEQGIHLPADDLQVPLELVSCGGCLQFSLAWSDDDTPRPGE